MTTIRGIACFPFVIASIIFIGIGAIALKIAEIVSGEKMVEEPKPEWIRPHTS